MRDMYEWLKRAVVFTLVVLAVAVASDAAFGDEFTSGATVRGSGFTGGEHYEYTWYTDDEDWRFGVAYTTSQVLDNATTVCGSLGSEGEICYPRDLKVEAYPSAYIQRLWRKRKVYAAFGLAMHEERRPLLSTTATFRTSLGYQFDRRWSLEWTHMSNGTLRKPNWGQDIIIVRYRWSR